MDNLNAYNYTVLTAPDDVKVQVFKGFDDSENPITPALKETKGQETVSCYNLPRGNYHFLSQGDGYYTWHKNFIITDENLKNGGKRINADPGKLSADRRYEANPERINYSLTDEFLTSSLINMDGFLGRFPALLDTPAFSPNKANAQFTSQEEMEAFIKRHLSDVSPVNIVCYGICFVINPHIKMIPSVCKIQKS